ncbi:MAG: PAS domain-containing protein, partial [Desulfocapsaceae bacterium]|nr:PAS domain-containing protein [Desulfocapsaceae bacterium]
MKEDKHTQPRIPRSTRSFHLSRTVVGLLLATTALAVVLVFSTLRNIDREQALMEKFLRDKGETIIRSIEAGSRTTMMHHMGGGNPLHTLLEEYSKDKDIEYILVTDANRHVDEQFGRSPALTLSDDEINQILTENRLITKLDRETGVYRLFKLFQARGAPMHRHMHSKYMNQMYPGAEGKMILSIGLLTRQFDLARQQDVRHAIFMGAILFLVGSAGLYFLFLYQQVRVTSLNLADMKLYTDNVIESIPVCIITLDADDRVVSCNRNTEELFDVDFSQLQTERVQDVLPYCNTSFTSACDQLLEHETECRISDGKTIPLRISCSPLENSDGQQIGKVLILRDMSALKEMELQLERSRRMAALGKMAAGIAH